MVPIKKNDKKLSFIMPVAVSTGRDGKDVARIETVLSSLLKFFNMDQLSQFLIFSPPSDLSSIKNAVRRVTKDTRFEVISELEICPEFARKPQNKMEINGWYRQQVVKLAASEFVQSNFYMTLDSDVICVKYFSHDDLIENGKALCNTESLKDYRDLYKPDFALKELNRKMERTAWAQKILGIPRPEKYKKVIYGETPVLLKTEFVRLLCEFLEKKYEMSWRHALMNHLPWTEYPLYFQFLESAGILEKGHLTTHRNGLLRLDQSLWQPPSFYRKPPTYWDPSVIFNKKRSGYFVVVQSLLEIDPREVWESVAPFLARTENRPKTRNPPR